MSSETIYTPYTYMVYHKPSRKFYYGSRTAIGCSPNDLWSEYFTSSEVVKQLIETDGIDNFLVKVHKTFQSREECLKYEYNMLQHFKAGINQRFLNKNHGYSACCVWTDAQRKKSSESHKGKQLSDHHRQRISESKAGKSRRTTPEGIKNAAKARTGLRRTEETKAKQRISSRKRAPHYTFTRNNEAFYGSTGEWSEQFGFNPKTAATVFHSSDKYKGWIRL